MMILKKIALLASALVLAACATATPYQQSTSADARNGFSEIQIENDRTRISFDGNSLTKRDTVETYLLFRAAELTKQKGYDFFTLTDRATDEKTRVQYTGFNDPYYGYFDYAYFHPRYGWSNSHYRGRFRSYLGFYDPFYDSFGYNSFGRSGWANDFDYREITRYRASAEVKFSRGQKPLNADNAFNAQEVIDNLGGTIIYPEAKT